MIYLDNAATTCPKPVCVSSAVYAAVKTNCANPGRSGHDASMRAQQTVFALRTAAADLFGCDSPERVILTKNCTESLNIAIRGLLENGHVLCSVYEHNSVLRPLEQLKEHGILEYDTVPVYPDTEKTVRAFRSLLRSDTRAIVCTHVSNVFGAVLPVKELLRLAKENGLLFILDAAQSAGTYRIDMRDGYDAVCMPGHKGLYGPTGTGLLLLGKGIQPKALLCGGTGSLSHERKQPEQLPDALESGTLNVPGAAGLTAGIAFVKSIGIDTIRQREIRFTQELCRALQKSSKLITYADEYTSKTLLSFNARDIPSERLASMLNCHGIAVRAGYHCAYEAHRYAFTDNGGTVRVSPGVFNTENELEQFVKKLYIILK